MRLAWATVVDVILVADGLERLSVEFDDATAGTAVCYPRLSGTCVAGERVLLNTTAVDLNLGTGGSHFVVARLASGQGEVLNAPAGGHVMKLRYTPLQVDVLSVESQESPYHQTMKDADDLEGMPVVCCGLHSQVPLVAAAIKQHAPALSVAYCMTDHAALVLPMSDLVRSSVASGLLDVTLTCGQAFGGDLEAVNLHSGLLAARHVARADVAIVAIGPGVVGTATAFGHGGICQGEAINAVGSLGGIPVACLRVSFADMRERHRGVSHHSLAALSRIALTPARVAVPALETELLDAIQMQLESSGVWDVHERMNGGVEGASAASLRGVRVTTMGRGIEEDPAFFEAAFAAGEIASRLARPVL